MYNDKTLTCRDCGNQFTFTSSEQAFFAEKGFQNEPGRCPSCRAERRSNGGGRMGGYRDGERQMYDTICASCGVETQVPFLPRGDRPVYCRDCYVRVNPRY